jgi:hypothetical protein
MEVFAQEQKSWALLWRSQRRCWSLVILWEKVGVDVGEVGVGKGGGAKGVAKEACDGSDFSGSVPRILFNVVDGIAEGELVLRGR